MCQYLKAMEGRDLDTIRSILRREIPKDETKCLSCNNVKHREEKCRRCLLYSSLFSRNAIILEYFEQLEEQAVADTAGQTGSN